MSGSQRYADHLTEACGHFKTGGPFQSLPTRRSVTDATETARISQWREDGGGLVDCVNVYLATDDIPDEVREVADHHGMDLAEREDEKLTFIP